MGRGGLQRTAAPALPVAGVLRSETWVPRPAPELKGLHGPPVGPSFSSCLCPVHLFPSPPAWAPSLVKSHSPFKSWLSGLTPRAAPFLPQLGAGPSLSSQSTLSYPPLWPFSYPVETAGFPQRAGPVAFPSLYPHSWGLAFNSW